MKRILFMFVLVFCVGVSLAVVGTAFAQAGIKPPDPDPINKCVFRELGADISPYDWFGWRVERSDYSICKIVIFDGEYRELHPGDSDPVYSMNWTGDRLLYATKDCAECPDALTVYFYIGIRLDHQIFLPVAAH